MLLSVSVVLCIFRWGLHTALETGPDAVVESALYAFGFDPSLFQQIQHFVCYLWATHVRILLFVVVAREPIKARLCQFTATMEFILNILIDQISLFGCVDLDCLTACLPMGRENDHRSWLDLGRNLATDLREFAVGRVLHFVHDVWLVVLAMLSLFLVLCLRRHG